MKINRPLMPGFLKKAEQKLLLNKPGIWSTRTHLVLYYGLLFIIFLAVLCFFEPSDLRMYSTTEYWIGFASIISIIAITVWLIYLLRFNVFKKFGILHPLSLFITFLLYFISAGIIVLFVFVHPAVESIRANMAYSSEELVNDINAINIKICQLEYKILQQPWQYDTVAVIKNEQPAESKSYDDDAAPAVDIARRRLHFLTLNADAFANRRSNTDSLIKLNDTLYIMYITPTYSYVSASIRDKSSRQKLLSSFELYNKILKHPNKAINRTAIRKELGVLLHKYHYQENENLDYDGYTDSYDIIYRKYHTGHINDNIYNIVSKKYRWSSDLPAIIRAFYYFTITISLLLFIFRHSTVRTFFLSLLACLLLTILTSLVLSFLNYRGKAFFYSMIFYSILFFIGSLSAWFIKKRMVLTGISINLFVIVIPILPLLLLFGYYHWKYDEYLKTQKPVYLIHIDQYMPYAETGGAVLLLVLMATYISKIYRQWYSLPEE